MYTRANYAKERFGWKSGRAEICEDELIDILRFMHNDLQMCNRRHFVFVVGWL